MNTHLEESADLAKFLSEALIAANGKASAVESIILQDLCGHAARLEQQIERLISATRP